MIQIYYANITILVVAFLHHIHVLKKYVLVLDKYVMIIGRWYSKS